MPVLSGVSSHSYQRKFRLGPFGVELMSKWIISGQHHDMLDLQHSKVAWRAPTAIAWNQILSVLVDDQGRSSRLPTFATDHLKSLRFWWANLWRRAVWSKGREIPRSQRMTSWLSNDWKSPNCRKLSVTSKNCKCFSTYLSRKIWRPDPSVED